MSRCILLQTYIFYLTGQHNREAEYKSISVEIASQGNTRTLTLHGAKRPPHMGNPGEPLEIGGNPY